MQYSRALLSLIAALLSDSSSAAPPPVPANFSEPDTYGAIFHAMEEGQQKLLAQPIQLDFRTRAGEETCVGLEGWTGQATFVTTEQGTLNYWGTGQGCMPYGFGTVQYPDGSIYFGAISTYFDDPGSRGIMRVLVREGAGQYHDARTGQQQIGRFSRDVFVQDLSRDAGFVAALQAASASVAGSAAPRWTPAVRHLVDNWKAASTAAPKVAAAPALPTADGANADPDAARQSRAQAALDPTRVPAQILAFYTDLAALQPALARYGMATTTGLPAIDSKFLGGVKCKSPAGQDARWSRAQVLDAARLETAPAVQDAYLGEHVECKPRGIGRYRFGEHEWIGQVDNLRMREEGLGTSIEGKISAMPGGVGEIRLGDGTRLFVKASYILPEKAERSGYMFGRIKYEAFYGLVDAEGTVAVALKPNRGATFDAVDTGWAFFQKDLAQNKEFTEHRLDGTQVTGMFDMKTGTVTAGHVQVVNPDKGYAISGMMAVEGDGTEPYWYGRTDIRISNDSHVLPRGQYYSPGSTKEEARARGKWRVTLSKHTNFIHAYALPADVETLMRAAERPKPCNQPAGELPQGWVLWTPSCSAVSVRAYAPDLSHYLEWSLAEDGKVKRRALVRAPGMGDRSREHWEVWAADAFRQQGGKLVPIGVTDYQVTQQGRKTWHWIGPMNGLVAEGIGQCDYRGQLESCETKGNQRVDAVHLQRVAQQRLAQQRENERQARMAAAQREQERLAAIQREREEAAEEEARLQREMEEMEAEEAEPAAPHWTETFAKAMGQVANDMAQVNAQRQQDFNAKQAQIADMQRRQRDLQQAQQNWNAGVAAHNQSQKDAAAAIAAGAKFRPASSYSSDQDEDEDSGSASAGGGERGAPKLPAGQTYTGIKDECGQLGRDLMSAKYQLEQRCLRQKRDDETFGAWRDAQNSCMADGKGEVDSLQAEYSACSKRDPSEGGVVRY